MKKVLFTLPFALFCLAFEADAQTAQPAQGQPVSNSRDAIMTPSPEVQSADSAGTPVSAGKDVSGPVTTAPADLPASPSGSKADDKKKPK